ncbi:SMC family ATPase [bacterium]|nr:SMC family ATPase [bacterium]
MRLLSLSLEGFMPYRQQQTLDFRNKELFALVGPTGSGKSALLDAITFAFYGKTPRWQESRPGKDLISQGESRLTVEVQFQVKGRIYQVIRTVKRAGTHDAQLRHQQDGEFRPLSAERRTTKQVSDELVGLLGMDYATFTKTLMLPQGQFDRLLKPKEPKERKELLIQLAGLTIYDRVADRLAQRLKPLELEVRGLEVALSTFEAVDEAYLHELEQQLLRLQSEREHWQALLALAQQTTQQLQADLQRVAELQQHELAIRQLQARQPALDQIKQRLQDSARVESQQGHLHHLDQLRAQWLSLEEHLEQAVEQRSEAELRLQDCRKILTEAQQQALELPTLQERKESLLRLQESLDTYAELERERAALGLEALHDQEQELRQKLSLLSPALQETIEALERCHADLARLGEAGQLAAWQGALDACQSWHKARGRGEQLGRQLANLETALADLELRLPEVRLQLEQAESQRDRLRHALDQAQQQQTGAELRQQLQLDCPCPVCLQPVSQLPPSLGPDSRLPELRQQLTQAEKVLAGSQRQLHKVEAEMQAQGEQSQALHLQHQQAQRDSEDSWQRLLQRTPDPQVVELEALEARVEQAADQDRQRSRAQQELTCITARASQLETEVQVSNTRLEALQQQMLQTRQQQQRLEEKLLQRRQQLERTLEVDHDFEAVTRQRLIQVEGRIGSLADGLKRAELAAQQADSVLRQSEQSEQIYRDQHGRLGSEVHSLERQLMDILGRLQLADEQALRSLLLSAEERDRLQREVEEHGQRLHSAQGRVTTLLDQLQQRRPDAHDLSRAQQSQSDLEQGVEERVRQHGALQQQLQNARQQLEKAGQLRQAYRAAQHRLALHKKLATMVSVTGLKAYVANRLLHEILRLASGELERLSGRYQLRLKDDDILVEDGWNAGETRDVRSLSGGETFLASLSLALAMVEYLAQGSPLESLFIDEGFGTLDPETLEAVTQTLESLQAKGRLVGVITHVTELAERLPVQIRVEKLQGQSRLSACGTLP